MASGKRIVRVFVVLEDVRDTPELGRLWEKLNDFFAEELYRVDSIMVEEDGAGRVWGAK